MCPPGWLAAQQHVDQQNPSVPHRCYWYDTLGLWLVAAAGCGVVGFGGWEGRQLMLSIGNCCVCRYLRLKPLQ